MSQTRLDLLLESLATDGDDPFVTYAIAQEYRGLGKLPEAEHWFTRTLELAPDYIAAYHQWGAVLAEEGRLEEAKEKLRAGIELARRLGRKHDAAEMTDLLDTLEE